MPRGRYSFHDPHDGTPEGGELFACAPGPAGWRYTATRLDAAGRGGGSLDLSLDSRGRPVRLDITAGGWRVRGGATSRDGEPSVAWVRGADGQGVEDEVHAHGFTGRSPGFLVAVSRMLTLAPGEQARVRLVELSEPSLGARVVEQLWTLTLVEDVATELHPLPVARYEVVDTTTAETAVVHIAGDVVLAAPGIELEDLETPPNLQ